MTTLEKAVTRKTRGNFMHYKRPLVVSLLPGDVLRLRELRRKREVFLDLHSLYIEALRRQLAAEKREKRAKRRS
jgi:hypothetical protein